MITTRGNLNFIETKFEHKDNIVSYLWIYILNLNDVSCVKNISYAMIIKRLLYYIEYHHY